MFRTHGGAQFKGLHERQFEVAAHEGKQSFGVARNRFAVGERVGHGGGADDVGAGGIQAGIRGIEPGERGADVAEIFAAVFAAKGEADAVAAPQRPDLAAGVEVDAAQARPPVALEHAIGGLFHRGRIAEGARVDEDAVLDGVAAAERIERAGRVGLQGGRLREAGALDGLVFIGATLGLHDGRLPRPRVAKASAQAEQAAVGGISDLVLAGTEVPEAVVDDIDR